jgi:hypothetical protein
MKILFLDGTSPIRNRKWAVHTDLLGRAEVAPSLIVGQYSLQPKAVARYALKRTGLSLTEQNRVLNMAQFRPTDYGELVAVATPVNQRAANSSPHTQP